MRRAAVLSATLCWLFATASVQGPQDPRPSRSRALGPGPAWGGQQPRARNEVFATADGCAQCHSAAPDATAMRSPLGEDVSPHATWQATVMANSFRDPYWRAQVARECAEDPHRAGEVQALCLRCHAPMHHHTRALGGQPPTTAAEAARDPLAQDGVSCAVCHQIRARHLGEETTWSGKGRIGRGRVIYGPYEEPDGAPMQGTARYAPQHGAHVQTSALCATCHTLLTTHQGAQFPEQTPYLEWRNSVYSDEQGATETSRTCQQCHMPDVGATRIARDPSGADYLLEAREPYRAHAFVGGNAFLLDLLRDNRAELAVEASAAALQRMAHATRRQLTTATVDVEIGELAREDDELRFQVRVRNKTGHKFPTGYPSRRAWLHVRVQNERGVAFECGAFTNDGEIVGVIDPLTHEHVTRVETPYDVVVWELVALDADGEPTTSLTRMAARGKDSRLLPSGWSRGGPHAELTAPVGLGNDFDFTAGGDTVHVTVPYDAGAPRATVSVWVHYQTIPPHWVEPLREVDADECRAFVRMYDAAGHAPETIAAKQRSERL